MTFYLSRPTHEGVTVLRNPYSEDERLEAMVSAAVRACRSHFNHLPIRHLISPPRDMFDAKLARQIAIHVLCERFDIPRRRVVKLLGVGRAMVLQSIRTVERRREDPVFERAYDRIAARAMDTFMAALADDAEAA